MKHKTSSNRQVLVQDVNDGSGDCYIEFPPDVIKDVGWKAGDDIKFIPQSDGSFLLKKVKYESVELDLDDDTFNKVALLAHENNVTFNQQVEEIMTEFLEQSTTKETDK